MAASRSASRVNVAPLRRADPAEDDGPLLDLQDSLGYAIKQAQVRAYAVFFRMLGPDTLTPARMTALSMIGTGKGINQSALAERLGITRASMVKVIDSLQDLGLILREEVPGDRRSYALVLTPKGRQELKRYARKVAEIEKAYSARLTPAERRQLMQLLQKVGID